MMKILRSLGDGLMLGPCYSTEGQIPGRTGEGPSGPGRNHEAGPIDIYLCHRVAQSLRPTLQESDTGRYQATLVPVPLRVRV
jgi:hypothetical protein